MRLWLAFLVAVFAGLTMTNPGLATSCWRPSAAEHIASADTIFYGEVIGGQFGPADNKDNIVEFKVLRAYKGVQGETIRIEYFNDHGGLRGWGFAEGQATLVFADQTSDTAIVAGTAGSLNYCSMIPYHARAHMHADYWDILATLNN